MLADTSGLYAVLDADDRFHAQAARAWRDLASSDAEILLHHFVLVEVWTLLQARLGFRALETFVDDFRPRMTLHAIPDPLLDRGMTRCRVAGRRDLSLTDCVSIEFMKERGMERVFAFDRHFRESSFLLPGKEDWLGPR